MTDHFLRTDLKKEEVARRQIDRAIQMYFENDDPIATHVLANAGWTIARDVCRDLGRPDTLATMEGLIRQDKRREVRDRLRASYNFFKHADRDTHAQLEHFDEIQTEWTIVMAEYDYSVAFEQRTPLMLAYRTWAFARYPNTFLEGNEIGQRVAAESFPNLPTLPPRQAKALGLSIISDRRRLEIEVAIQKQRTALGQVLFTCPEAIAIDQSPKSVR